MVSKVFQASNRIDQMLKGLITNNEIVVTLVEVEFMEVVAFGIL